MIVTAVLVRWGRGWHNMADGDAVTRWGRKEGTLGIGAAQTLDEIHNVVGKQLAMLGRPRAEIACDLAPLDKADIPYVGFGTADIVTVPDVEGRPPADERVQSITAAMDENGLVTYAVELKDVLTEQRERLDEAIAKMVNGTLGGEAKIAQPVNTVPAFGGKDCCPPTAAGWAISSSFDLWDTYSGSSVSDRTDPWTADVDCQPRSLVVEATVSGQARVGLVQSGEVVGAVAGVIAFLDQGDSGPGTHVVVTMPYPPATTIAAGTIVWFEIFPWIDVYPDGRVENLKARVTFAGGHPDVPLNWPYPT